jgi:ferritin-like metal-binding protein YciE
MKTLKDLFLDELADMYDAENRIIKALPKMAKAATCTHLRDAFLSHLRETEGQVKKLDQVFHSFDIHKPRSKKCAATVGLLEEGDEIAADFKGSPAINAALISAAQKVEHYEMASYGCLHEWATLLENAEASALLEEILEQEKAANASLNALALARSNQEALGEEASDASSRERRGNAREGNPAQLRPVVLGSSAKITKATTIKPKTTGGKPCLK